MKIPGRLSCNKIQSHKSVKKIKAATALRGYRYHQNTLHYAKGKLIFYFLQWFFLKKSRQPHERETADLNNPQKLKSLKRL